MSKKNRFTIEPWEWSSTDGVLCCRYRAGDISFSEYFSFPVRADLDERLARSFDLLSVAASVSYYKIAPFDELHLASVADLAAWSSYVYQLYDHGMREYRFTNGLPLRLELDISFGSSRSSASEPAKYDDLQKAALVPMGGGRDSLLVAFALRGIGPTLATVGSNPVVALQAKHLGLNLHNVGRTLDPSLIEMNRNGLALNGHVPVTAINSSAAVSLAVMLRLSDVVMSNESSASAPTRIVENTEINHQYSKSLAYENSVRTLLAGVDRSIRFFSLLRSEDELEISRLIAKHWNSLPPFVSCNVALTQANRGHYPRWCGGCAKCYFVFLALAPFLGRHELIGMFGRDLLASAADTSRLEDLLLTDNRHFECIGTPDETRRALSLIAEGEWRDLKQLRLLADRYPPARTDEQGQDLRASNAPIEYAELLGSLR